jgi:hypothetical protein
MRWVLKRRVHPALDGPQICEDQRFHCAQCNWSESVKLTTHDFYPEFTKRDLFSTRLAFVNCRYNLWQDQMKLECPANSGTNWPAGPI